MGISREQALDCFKSDDLIGIGMEADAVRRQLHPEGVVSYGMEHFVLMGCRSEDEVFAQTRSAEEMGATGVALVGRIGGGLAESTQLDRWPPGVGSRSCGCRDSPRSNWWILRRNRISRSKTYW